MLWRLGVVVFSFATSLGVLYLLARWTAVQAHNDYDGGGDDQQQHNKLYFPSNLVELKDVVNVLSSISIYKVASTRYLISRILDTGYENFIFWIM